MVNIGIAGLGFMGMTHYRGIQKVRGAKDTAICTRDPGKQQGDWRGIGGNFGAPGNREDLSKVRVYGNYDDLLTDARSPENWQNHQRRGSGPACHQGPDGLRGKPKTGQCISDRDDP